MALENQIKGQGGAWFIDLGWYEQQNRSFPTLAEHCLCPRCRRKLAAGKIAPGDILTTVKDCCGKSPSFITARSSLLENLFRILMANGNEPQDLPSLSRKLTERIGGYRIPEKVLSRLLQDERYYGIRKLS